MTILSRKTRTTAVHIGLLRRDIFLIPGHWDAIIDGDSWEDWGEKTEAGNNEPFHVMIMTRNSASVIAALHSDPQLLEALVPMTQKHQKDTILVVTPEADWSKVIRSYKRQTRLVQEWGA